MNITTLRVSDETKSRLRKFKEYPEQTDDRLLNKILDELEKVREASQ